MEKFGLKSIRSRVVWSFVAVIVFVVGILGTLFVTTVKQYYYGSAAATLRERATVTTAFYNQYVTSALLFDKARYILENIPEEELAKIEIIDMDGRLVLDSNGFAADVKLSTEDVKQALRGETGQWIGLDPLTHEKILALSNALLYNGHTVGVVRFSTSMTMIDKAVGDITKLALAVGMGVILLSLSMSLLLAKRIVNPIRELTRVAQHMAGGNFARKAVKRHDDEIGRLAETLNYMASEITKNERLKNDFIASVSHELRTPLTSIKGWGETLLLGDLHDKEETSAGLQVISKETDRLIGLVEELLDFSKLQEGAIKVVKGDVELNRLVADIGSQFFAGSQRIGLDFRVEAGSEPPVRIDADANRIKQVLVNLIDNAMKFTPAGGTVSLTIGREEPFAVIQVRDSGEGISADDLPHVKEKFYKGRTNKPGNGIGLSICEQIVQLHGGSLNVASIEGEGTTVTLLLPIKESEAK